MACTGREATDGLNSQVINARTVSHRMANPDSTLPTDAVCLGTRCARLFEGIHGCVRHMIGRFGRSKRATVSRLVVRIDDNMFRLGTTDS
jgi:hypothetical protein